MVKKIIIFIMSLSFIFSLSSCKKNIGYIAELSKEKEAEIREKVLSGDAKTAPIYFYGQYDDVYVIGYTYASSSVAEDTVIKYKQYVFGYPNQDTKIILYNESKETIMPFSNYIKSKKLGKLDAEWIDEAYYKNIQDHFIKNHPSLYQETESQLGIQIEHEITSAYIGEYISEKEEEIYYSTTINNYYGTYNGYKIVVMNSSLFASTDKLNSITIDDLTFITAPRYLIKSYKDGKFYDLNYLYENNLITKDDLTNVYNQHKSAFQHLYLG